MAIVEQGFSDMEQFASLTEKDIIDFVKAINKIPAADGRPRPSIPFASIKKLKAMRNWTIERRRLGIEYEHNDFNASELARIIERMDFEEKLSINKPVPPALPDKFTSFGTKWRIFSEGFQGHCSVLRGCMNIPLSYVLREHGEVDPELLEADFDSSDERLMNLVVLSGDEYRQDNIRVWDLLRPLVYGTPAWDYVKSYDAPKNGRTAFQVLQKRGEGEAAQDARRTEAEAKIANAQYTGKSRAFTLQSYINLLQGAFTELEECGEEYALTERQKVDAFVKGLVSERFQVTRQSIIGNVETRNDFQKAYAFVETMERFQSVTTHDGRRVAEAKRKNEGLDDNLKRFIPKEEWLALPAEERHRIQSARDKAKFKAKKLKAKKPGKKKKPDIRKLAEALREVETSLQATGGGTSGGQGGGEGAQGGSPADQFGRNVEAARRRIAAITAELDGTSAQQE
jgi:hypothetical protein